jgi:hypothetical protein
MAPPTDGCMAGISYFIDSQTDLRFAFIPRPQSSSSWFAVLNLASLKVFVHTSAMNLEADNKFLLDFIEIFL